MTVPSLAARLSMPYTVLTLSSELLKRLTVAFDGKFIALFCGVL
ncbi:hypothetical protein [Candidatus Protochlamydia amoebophila]|nr:hypothetical protein [Candidatus Protochlamydia amoebophila]